MIINNDNYKLSRQSFTKKQEAEKSSAKKNITNFDNYIYFTMVEKLNLTFLSN